MIFKTLVFLLLLYFLVRVISRLFLPSSGKKRSNIRFFYQVFKKVKEQQNKQPPQNSQRNKKKGRFEEIEEAEFEDVTEEEEPKSSDS